MTLDWHAILDFFRGVWMRMSEGYFSLIAAGVAFYALFALFPGLAASVAIFGLISDPVVISEYLEVAEQFLPVDAGALVHGQVMGLLSTPRATLGWATFVSISVAVYSARAGVAALITGLEVVHRTSTLGFIWRILRDFFLTVTLVCVVIIGFATVLVMPLILSFLSLGPMETWLLSGLPWLATFLLLASCLAILYRFGPNFSDDYERPPVLAGIIVASVTWSLVSFGFSAYLANFDSYNRIYGSIGAVAALLMWLYFGSMAILLGGAINAELGAPHRRRTGAST